MPDEEFNREEEFKYITRLDGTPVGLKPSYERDCRLDRYDSDEEEADESEHEGYTGNEGAPITTWYRQTVVLLVPPSRKLDFRFTNTRKYGTAYTCLKELELEAEKDASVKKQLHRLCQLLLPKYVAARPPAYPCYDSGQGRTDYRPAEERDCMRHMGTIALENDWQDLFYRVLPLDKTSEECLEALGMFFANKGMDRIKPVMMRMLDDAVNTADKYRLLQEITRVLREHSSNDNKHEAEFAAWYKEALADVLKTTPRACKEDGIAMGQIARACTTDEGAQLLSKLKSSSAQTMIAFIFAFVKDNSELAQPAQAWIAQEALDYFWENFHYSQPTRTYGAPVDALNQQELMEIMDFTKGCSRYSVSDAFRFMSRALGEVDEKYIREVLFPFVRAIMTHDISSVIVDEDPSILDAVAANIQMTLCTYIRRVVPREPQMPKDWSLPDRGCSNRSCDPCRQVDAFMADPKRRTFTLCTSMQNRQHLDREFYGTAKYCPSEKEYVCSVDRTTKPMSWVCTKEHKAFYRDHPRWDNARRTARNWVESLGTTLLKPYLGEHYGAIVTCQIERLPDLGSKELAGREPLSDLRPSNMNAAHGSMKRKYDPVYSNEAPGSKRVRHEAEPGPAEIIDLTRLST